MHNNKKRDWIEGGESFGALFLKKVPCLANIGRFPNFLDLTLELLSEIWQGLDLKAQNSARRPFELDPF